MRSPINSPLAASFATQRALQDLANTFLSSPSFEALRSIQESVRLWQESEKFRQLQRATGSFKSWQLGFEASASMKQLAATLATAQQQSALLRSSTSLNLEALNGLSQSLARQADQVSRHLRQSALAVRVPTLALERFPADELYRLAQRVAQHSALTTSAAGWPVEASTTGAATVEAIPQDIAVAETLATVSRELSTGRVGPLGLEFLLNVLLNLIFFIVTLQLTSASEHRLIAEIDHAREQILAELKEAKGSPGYYRVVRPTRVAAGPRANTPIVGNLLTGQFVCLLSPSRRQVPVAFVDYISGTPKEGWCLKKYLRRDQ
jgi:hypothetical protein